LLANAKTLSVTVDVSAEMERAGQMMQSSSRTHVVIERPGHVNITMMRGKSPAQIVANDKNTYFYLSDLDRFIVRDPIKHTADLLDSEVVPHGISIGNALLTTLLLPKDPYQALLHGAQRVSMGKPASIDGVECDCVDIVNDRSKMSIFVRKSGDPLIVAARAAPDLGKLLELLSEEKRAKLKLTNPELYTRFSDWKLNENLSADAFAFRPSESANAAEEFYDEKEQRHHPLVGKKAPAFSTQLLSGEQIKLSDHLGKQVVVLDFWATWCAPCVKALPTVTKITGEYKDKGVAFYAVNSRESAEKIEAFLKKRKLTTTVALDKNGRINAAYEARAIPQTVIIDKKGYIQVIHVGIPEDLEGTLRAELDAVLAGKQLHEHTE
jgi:peroxiredoxin